MSGECYGCGHHPVDCICEFAGLPDDPRPLTRDPTDWEVNDACMSYDHSFGLMSIADANRLRFQAREWLRAWQKVEASKERG